MNRPVRVGELRPSQLLHTFGIGAVVDLPSISALVQGLDEWAADHTEQVHEPRLLAAVRDRLGQQVATLRLPPYTPDDGNRLALVRRDGVMPVITHDRGYLGPDGLMFIEGRLDGSSSGTGLWSSSPTSPPQRSGTRAPLSTGSRSTRTRVREHHPRGRADGRVLVAASDQPPPSHAWPSDAQPTS